MGVVTAIACHALSLPLHTPFVTALRRTSTIDTLVVQLHTDGGQVGLGEAPQVWAVTGESVVGARACVEQILAPLVVGRSTDDWQTVCRALTRSCARNFGAKSAVETALLDVVAREAGVTLAAYLAEASGAAPSHQEDRSDAPLVVPTDVTVSAGSAASLAAAAAARVAEGFTHLKLKVGTDARTDVERVRAVREAVGPEVVVRLDANQGWSPPEAVEVIAALADAGLGVQIVEQPVAGEDVEGLAWVRERVPLPVLADESVYGPTDLERVIRLRAADAVNVKLAKCGGPLAAVRLLRRAREAGLGTMVGSMMESHLGVAAAAAVVLAVGGTTLVPDLDAAWWTTGNPFVGGVDYGPGMLHLPAGAGLGTALTAAG